MRAESELGIFRGGSMRRWLWDSARTESAGSGGVTVTRRIGSLLALATLLAGCGPPAPDTSDLATPCVLPTPNSLNLTGNSTQSVSSSTLWLRSDGGAFVRFTFLVSRTSPAVQYQYEATSLAPDGGPLFELGTYEVQPDGTLRLYPSSGPQSRFGVEVRPVSRCDFQQLVLSCQVGSDCGRNDLIGTYDRQ